MDLRFIGTGAADYVGKNPRRRFTSTLVEGVLVDASNVIWEALENARTSPDLIRHVIYTHSHDDHYSDPVAASFEEKLPHLQSVSASTTLMERIRLQCPRPRWAPQAVVPGQKVRLDALEWEAFRANHPSVDPPEIPLNYRVSQGEWRVLIFNDTALPYLETVRALRDGPPSHVLMMDATMGMIDDDFRMFEHASIQQVSRVASCWKELGILRADALVLCNHLSRTLLARKPPSSPSLRRLGVRLAPEGGRLQLAGHTWRLTDAQGKEIDRGEFKHPPADPVLAP